MTNAADKAYGAIREGIITGRHLPGARLKEELLAEEAGVSRTPIREALRTLASEGLVQMIPNSGYFVTSWSNHDISRICAIRALLESEAAKLAASNINYAELQRLRDMANTMSDLAQNINPDSITQIVTINRDFHHLILTTADDERLLSMALQIIELPISFRNFHSYNPAEMRRSMAHHQEIVTAFEHHDADWASAIMRGHILASKYPLLNKANASSNADEAAKPGKRSDDDRRSASRKLAAASS